MAAKSLRKLLFWGHLTAGVVAGVVILVMSFTGVVLALKPQILNLIERDVRFVTAQETPRLTPSALLIAVRQARPDAAPTSIAVDRDPTVSASVTLDGATPVFVNPYTGAILGSGSLRANQFFQTMTTWHRYMGASGPSRPLGKSIAGAANLVFLVLAMSGLYLWWPKQLTLQHLKPIVWFRATSTARARDFNWHNVIGFWCLPAIIVMTVSGAVISYPWASNLVYRLTGSPIPAARGTTPAPPARAAGQSPPSGVLPADFDRVWARAAERVPTWSLISARLGTRADAPVTFTITDGAHWNKFARSSLTVNGASAEVVQWQPYQGSSLGQKVRGWLRFAHTGELGGLSGQVVAGLGCLGGVFLVCTGLSLAFRRLVNWPVWGRVRAPRSNRAPHLSPEPVVAAMREALPEPGRRAEA